MSNQLTDSRQLLIVGTGLIGSSCALSARETGLFDTIIGYARSEESIDYCIKNNIIDLGVNNLFDASVSLKEGDIIVIAVPILAFKLVLAECINTKATIVDALSVKQYVVDEAKALQLSNLVPCHPIAGSERSGPSAAQQNLFKNKSIIISADDITDKQHVINAESFWTSLGGNVEYMPAQQHDVTFAATSHLPHVLAYALMNALNTIEPEYNVLNYAASGFKDFSRIAASDPTMWHDICLTNSDAIVEQINNYQQQIGQFKQAILNNDSEMLKGKIEQSQQLRRQLDSK